jgi:predicted O-methyltransferase YrrM
VNAQGLVSEIEGDILAANAERVPADLAIVEIGSYMGLSTCYLASRSSAPIYAIDLWDLKLATEKKGPRNKHKYAVRFDSKAAFARFNHNISANGYRERVTWIKAPSTEVAKAWTRPIGMLFIDGAHDKVSVQADYDAWSPFVTPGGVIAFHDADKGNVRYVVEEHVKLSGQWIGWELNHRLMVAQKVPE